MRYVVLLTSLAPEITGEQTPQEYPVPADLAPALARQLDLTPVVSGTGITVYANAAWIPERAEIVADAAHGGVPPASGRRRRRPAGRPRVRPSSPAHARCCPVRPRPPVLPGPASVGTVLTASAPAGRWNLVQPTDPPLCASPSFGWAGSYQVTRPGSARSDSTVGRWHPCRWSGSVIVWLAAVAVVCRTSGWAVVAPGQDRPPSAPGPAG